MWPEPVERVADFLRAARAQARIEEFPEGTPTARGRRAGGRLRARRRSSSRSCSCATAARRRAGAGRPARRPSQGRASGRGARTRASPSADEVEAATGFAPGAVAPFPLPGVERACSSTGRCSRTTRSGSAQDPDTTWRRSLRPSSSALPGPPDGRSRRGDIRFRLTVRAASPKEALADARDREDLDERRARGLGGRADPRRLHGLALRHPASSRGSAATRRRKGPAVFRLTDHLQRLHDSARLLHMELPYSVDELRAASIELIGVNGLPECYLRPIAFYGYGELGVAARGNPVDVGDHELALGRLPRRGGAEERHPRQDLVLAADRPERDPARRRRPPASTSTRCWP